MAVDHGYEIEARYYDAAYGSHQSVSADIGYYKALAEERGGPVLELGCGTGRVLLPIAQAGIECAGLDPSPAMLDVFRAKPGAEKVELHATSMQAFDLGAHRFEVVFSAFRTFQHLLTVDDQLDCLTLVRAHLAPGGFFAMDVFNPDLARTACVEEEETMDLAFPLGNRTVKRFARVTRDHGRQVATVHLRYEEFESGRKVEENRSVFEMRWFYHYELEHLLYRAGFSEVEVFGDFDRSAVSLTSPHLVVLAQ